MSNLKNYKHYVSEQSSFENNGASSSPAWMKEMRKSALTVFAEKGFPTTHEEDWKYTNISPIANADFTYAAENTSQKVSTDELKNFMIEGTKQHTLVFVDGHLSKELSDLAGLPKSIIVKNFNDALKSHSPVIREHLTKYIDAANSSFAAFNTAFMHDGAFILIPENTSVEDPIHCIFVSTKSQSSQLAVHLRNLFIVEKKASAGIAVSYRSTGDNTNLTNVVTEIVAKEGSRLEIVKIQKESDRTFHVDNFRAHQFGACSVNVFSLALGSALARNDMSIIIDGEAADCNLNGLYITAGEQLIDHHTFMHHIHPNCPSHELFKGILHGNSRAVFNGKVYVNPEAQKTDSKQTNRNLLLSDTAIVDTKPELEIFADDVKCTHGAAVGGMNESHAFYLKSRGIGEENTRGILTVGFAAEVTGKIVNRAVRHHVDAMVVDHLREKLGNTGLPDIVHD